MQKMLLKISLNIFVIAVATTLVAGATRYPPYCSQCEEEVWEEVPCEEISTSTTTTTTIAPRPTAPTPRPTSRPRPTRPKPHPTAPTPLPTIRPTSTPSYSSYNTTAGYHPTAGPHVSSTPSGAYHKCYCECKVGCKEFCRKVVVNNDLNKEITQITKTSQHGLQGQLEMKHVHHRKFVPDPYNNLPGYGPQKQPSSGYNYPVEGCGDGDSSCELPKPNYGLPKPPASAPVPPPLPSDIYADPKGTTYYPEALLDSSYSVDELTKLLQSEGLAKPNYAYQPQSLYYAPVAAPNYGYGPSLPLPLPSGLTPGPNPAPAPAPSYPSLPAPAPNPSPDGKTYSPVTYTYSGSVLNPKPAVANAYSSVPEASDANYQNTNYISKEKSPNAPNTYELTTPAPNSDQLGAPSLNSNPAYDLALVNYLKGYPYSAQPNRYPPYQAPYAISYPY